MCSVKNIQGCPVKTIKTSGASVGVNYGHPNKGTLGSDTIKGEEEGGRMSKGHRLCGDEW